MQLFSPTTIQETVVHSEDEYLFGWDNTPGIVSVWANREGQAIIWRREGNHVTPTKERFRPWLFAASLQDLAQIGSKLVQESMLPGESDSTTIAYRELSGPTESYRYLVSATNGRTLGRAILDGASQRLGRRIDNLSELSDGYYRVGPVEQYLMQTGKVYFRGLSYSDLNRLTNLAPAISKNLPLLVSSSSVKLPIASITS